MKIIVFLNNFPVLSESFVLNQITGLLDRGHDVAIFCHTPHPDPLCHPDVQRYNLLDRTVYYGIPSARPPYNKLKRLLEAFRILTSHAVSHWRPILRSLNFLKFGRDAVTFRMFFLVHQFLHNGLGEYEIAHCHYFPCGDLAVALKELGAFNGKIFTTLHGEATYTGERASRLIKALTHKDLTTLFRVGDLFLPMSLNERKSLINIGCDSDKIVVHRMGIDTRRFRPLTTPASSPAQVRLISVGRLVEKKGFEYAIKAVASILDICSNISYMIIGDGPLRNTLQTLIDSLQLGNRVKIIGPKTQEEVIEQLRQSHIQLAPSINSRDGDQEGIPVVIMEAMAIGLPVLTSNHAGIPELVENGTCGFVVNPGDVDTLAKRLHQLITSPELRTTMGNAARDIVKTNFDVDTLNDRLVCLFDHVLHGT